MLPINALEDELKKRGSGYVTATTSYEANQKTPTWIKFTLFALFCLLAYLIGNLVGTVWEMIELIK